MKAEFGDFIRYNDELFLINWNPSTQDTRPTNKNGWLANGWEEIGVVVGKFPDESLLEELKRAGI